MLSVGLKVKLFDSHDVLYILVNDMFCRVLPCERVSTGNGLTKPRLDYRSHCSDMDLGKISEHSYGFVVPWELRL